MASSVNSIFSSLEPKPAQILSKVLDFSEDSSSEGKIRRISEVLKQLNEVNKLRMVDIIANTKNFPRPLTAEEEKLPGFKRQYMRDGIANPNYLPRPLTDEERKLPAFEKLLVVKQLVNQTDHLGRTPLIRATIAAGGAMPQAALKAMRMLVCLEAEIDQQIAHGLTAEKYAISWDIPKALELLQKMREEKKSASLSS